MVRTKWSQKELKDIWAKGIKCFPDPKPGVRYGVSDDFLPVCINNHDARERFSKEESFSEIQSLFVHAKSHKHRFSGDLLWGGTGSGKSQTAVGLGLEYAFLYPGSRGLVGGRVYGDLKANVIDLYKQLLTIKSPWDHPAVKSYPSMTSSHNKTLIIEPYPGALWSEIEFFQMDDWERVRGRNRDWMHLEEISQFLDSSIIDEAPRRLRSMRLPVSHLICTTNPPESTSHFIYPKWHVNQYLETWGDKLKTQIGSKCTCQFCQACLDADLGEFSFDDQGFCINPKCDFKKATGGIPAKRDAYKIRDSRGVWHDSVCPGNEHYWRLIFSDASSNPHRRSDYLQTIIGSSDAKVGELYAKGKPMELNANNSYSSFSQLNINTDNVEFDPSKDLHFSFDFNKRPACSCVLQETLDVNGEIARIDCIDEVILFDIREILEKFGPNMTKNEFIRNRGAGPEHSAEYFMKKFPNFKQTVYLWGDPTATVKNTSPLEKTKFQIVHDILYDAGYKVKMMVDQDSDRSIPLLDRINNANWLFKDYYNKLTCFINQKCEYTITSIRDIKFDKSGQFLDKKLIDEYARRTTKVIYPEDIYKAVQFVSHPGDALTYYLYQRLPVIKKIDHAFFSIPGETSFKLQGNKIVETKSQAANEKKQQNEENPSLYIEEKEPIQTFMEQLEGMGASFDEAEHFDDSNFSSYFG